jgi:LacI family transcriptional regulator
VDDKQVVTLADVAERAGVSISTASKALNGKSRVSPATRTRVQFAARALSFRTSSGSIMPISSGKIGLLTSDLQGRFSLPILMGAEDTFVAGQLSVFLCDARGDAVRERHHIDALLSEHIDGLIVVGAVLDSRPSLGHDLGVPVVYAYKPSRSPDDISLIPDNIGGGRLAIEHLLSTGRTRIVHITGPVGEQAAIDRGAGIRKALDDAGVELVDETSYGEWSEKWGRSATAMILGRHNDVDAVVCDSDRIARGVLDVLKSAACVCPKTSRSPVSTTGRSLLKAPLPRSRAWI